MLLSKQQSTDRFRAAHFSQLRHLAMFALVVEAGSLTVAAQRLGIGKSSVSRQISELEAFVGARLLNRSTRTLSLTEAGQLIFQDCARLTEAATDALDKLDADLPLAGKLRIASTVEHGQYVLPPIVSDYLAANPAIDIELVLGDAFVDLIDNGIDLAIRVGSPGPSPQNISQKIADLRYRLLAPIDLPGGVEALKTPDDAARHPWLLNAGGPGRARWTFEKDGQSVDIDVPSRITSNAFNARIELAKLGGHLIALPNFIPESLLGDQLTEVLRDYRIVPDHAIYAVYPSARFLSPKVAEFLKLLRARHP